MRIAICGLGTVAQGVLELLARNRETIERRAGRGIEVVAVASRTPKPEVDLLGAEFHTDISNVVGRDDVDVVLELIGGEQAAQALIRGALAGGSARGDREQSGHCRERQRAFRVG